MLQVRNAVSSLRKNCTPNQNLACFVLYLKLKISTPLWNIYTITQIVQGIQKNDIEILVSKRFFKGVWTQFFFFWNISTAVTFKLLQ